MIPIIFRMLTSLSGFWSYQWFLYPSLLLHRDHNVWDTISSPWVVDGVNFHSYSILNYVNIIIWPPHSVGINCIARFLQLAGLVLVRTDLPLGWDAQVGFILYERKTDRLYQRVLDKYSIRLRADQKISSGSNIWYHQSNSMDHYIGAMMKLDLSWDWRAVPASHPSRWVVENYNNWKNLIVAYINLQALRHTLRFNWQLVIDMLCKVSSCRIQDVGSMSISGYLAVSSCFREATLICSEVSTAFYIFKWRIFRFFLSSLEISAHAPTFDSDHDTAAATWAGFYFNWFFSSQTTHKLEFDEELSHFYLDRTVKAFCLVNTKQSKGSQHLDRDRPHLFWPQSRWQYAWFSWTCSSRTVSSLDRGSWKISRWFSGVW